MTPKFKRPKTSVFIAVSLDGFIARKNGSLDWLDQANQSAPQGEDCGYKAFSESVDALVMGRNSFETVLGFGVQWPYGKKKVIILSHKGVNIPSDLSETVSSSSEPLPDLLAHLNEEGIKHVYVDGGLTIQSFLRAGLIDEITLTVVPVLLGEGKPLFGPLTQDIKLKHLKTRAYDFGYIQVHYAVESPNT